MTNRGSLQNSAKEDVYGKGDKVLNNQAKYIQEKEIRVAKRNYSGKLMNKGTNSLPVILLQCGKVWKSSPVTRHHPPALWRINNWQTIWMSFIAGLKKHHSHLLQPPSPPHLHLYCWKVKKTSARSSKRAREGRHQDQTTPHWSASSRAVTSLLTDRRLRSCLVQF